MWKLAVEKKIAKANGISARESGELVTIHSDGAEIRNATGERLFRVDSDPFRRNR
jgi:hypothetical protein